MILYFGNILSKYGKTPTSVETLGKKLEEIDEVIRFSDKKHQVLRLLDMFKGAIHFGPKAKYAVIDTYSSKAFYYSLLVGALLKSLRVKYIPILHGGNLPQRLSVSPILCKFLFTNAYINIAPSGYLKSRFESAGYRVLEIPNYIEIQEYPFLQRNKVRPRILWVRSFHRIYQPDLAIRVLERLRMRFPEAILCMVGPDKDGSLEFCKRIAEEKGLQEAVQFTGRLDKKDWIALSRDFDIFLNTTSVDNTPVSVMEAMALGMVVVSTKVGGIPWLFEHGRQGFMVEIPSEEQMVQILSDILDSKSNQADISSLARKKAEEWDWAEVRRQWSALLR